MNMASPSLVVPPCVEMVKDPATNDTFLQDVTGSKESAPNALWYIIVILTFYALSMVVLMFKYVRRESRDSQVSSYYRDFVKRDRILHPRYDNLAKIQELKKKLSRFDWLWSPQNSRISSVTLAENESGDPVQSAGKMSASSTMSMMLSSMSNTPDELLVTSEGEQDREVSTFVNVSLLVDVPAPPSVSDRRGEYFPCSLDGESVVPVTTDYRTSEVANIPLLSSLSYYESAI